MDRLTKSAHFILVKSTYLAEDYSRIFQDEIVCNYGIQLSIILDQGAQFTSRFSRSIQKGIGTTVMLRTAFHPQTDGQADNMIKILEDMLKASILDFKGNWDEHLLLVEIAYNNSFHSSISIAPYESLYGRRYRFPIG